MNVKYPFRPPECRVQEVNYGNTVLVQHENAVWWLGYIQDIDNDLIYVDFDSSVVGACWIPSRNVWSHRFIDENLPRQPGIPWPQFFTPLEEGTPGIVAGTFAVQVALREENNGPYRFRSGILTSGFYGFYCVKLGVESDCITAVSEAARYVIVHRWQIVAKLPSDESPLFNKRTGQVYRKHVVKLTTDHDHPVEVADAYRMYKYLLEARRNMPGFKYPLNYRRYRFFAKISTGSVEFICAEFHNDAIERSMCWNADSLQKAVCEKYDDAGLLRDRVNKATVQHITNESLLVGHSETRDLCLSELRCFLLVDVLLQLDLYAQTKIKRVCSQWHNLLTGSAASVHITIDAKVSATERRYLNNEDTNMCPWTSYKQGMECHYAYKLGWILNRAISAYTRTLVIINFEACTFASKSEILAEVLKLKNVRLSMIVIRNCAIWYGFGRARFPPNNLQNDSRCRIYILSKLGRFCDLLRVEKYTVRCIVWMTGNIFLWNKVSIQWPLEEGDFIRPECPGSILEVHSPQITISSLHFHSKDSEVQMMAKFLIAAEKVCPPVTKVTLDKVRATHARWVQTFVYPGQFDRFRELLQVYDGFHLDGTPQLWDNVDLRNIDVSRLSKLTLWAVDAFYRDHD